MGGVAGYVVVGLIAGLVGLGELISRYRDRPLDLARSFAAWMYLVLNAGAGVGALALIRAFGWDFGAQHPTVTTVQALVAGFGSLALLRSSLFNVRIGEEDVAVGPGSLVTLALDAADRGVDRSQARHRSDTVRSLMRDISFDKAQEALPSYAINLMESPTQEALARMAREIAALVDADMPPRIKSLNLGLAVLKVTGEDVLRAAVAAIRDDVATGE